MYLVLMRGPVMYFFLVTGPLLKLFLVKGPAGSASGHEKQVETMLRGEPAASKICTGRDTLL